MANEAGIGDVNEISALNFGARTGIGVKNAENRGIKRRKIVMEGRLRREKSIFSFGMTDALKSSEQMDFTTEQRT